MIDRETAVNFLWAYLADNLDTTQKELAAQLGYSPASVSDWLWGKKAMGYNALVKIQKFMEDNNYKYGGGKSVSDTRGGKMGANSL